MDRKGAESADQGLWQRWRALDGPSSADEPDALALAAYAEGRLNEVEAESVETWLAGAPGRLADIVAARTAGRQWPRPARGILDEAFGLVRGVAAAAAPQFRILPFPRRPHWRTALAWGGIAAGLICISLIGFSMGSEAYANLSGSQTIAINAPDGLDTPIFDNYLSDASGT